MKDIIISKLNFVINHFGLEAPITIAVAALVEKAEIINEEVANHFITSLIEVALRDEEYEEEHGDELYDEE